VLPTTRTQFGSGMNEAGIWALPIWVGCRPGLSVRAALRPRRAASLAPYKSRLRGAFAFAAESGCSNVGRTRGPKQRDPAPVGPPNPAKSAAEAMLESDHRRFRLAHLISGQPAGAVFPPAAAPSRSDRSSLC
jgi:hypothetical protein